MTKKKGIFSKIKNKLSKSEEESLDFSSDEFEEVDSDEYEEYEEDEESEITIDENGDFIEEDEQGFFSKIKSKFSKKDDEFEYIDEDEDEEFTSEETGQIQVNEEDIVLSPEINEDSLANIEVPSLELDQESIEEKGQHPELESTEEPQLDQQEESEFNEASSTDIKINAPKQTEVEAENTHSDLNIATPQDVDTFSEHEDNEEEMNFSEFPLPSNGKKSRIPLFDNLLRKFKRKDSTESGKRISIGKEPFKNTKGLTEISKEQIIPSLIGKSARRRVHITFIYMLTAILFYNVGKFGGLYLSKEKPSTKVESASVDIPKSYSPRKDIAAIRNANPFNALESEEEAIKKPEPKKKEPEIKVCKVAKTKSRLPIKLLNTVVLQDSVKSVASVSRRGKVLSIREGDKIDNLAEVGKINRRQVIFKNLDSKTCEFIENQDKSRKLKPTKVLSRDEGRKVMDKYKNDEISVAGNEYKIKKSLRDRALADMGKILTQARAIQIKNPDGTLSFKMTEIVPGSIYSQLDIQNGDVITAVGGKRIQNINQLMTMFGKIKQNDNYEITVKRDGSEKTMNYNFTD